MPSALIRGVGWSFSNIQLAPCQLKLEMQEKRRVWSSGSSSNPLHQPRSSAHGSVTLLPKKRYKSSSHAFAIKITIVLLKDERQKWIFLTTLTKLKLKEAPDSSALLIQAFLDVYDNCLWGNLFKFVCKQRVCTHLQPPRECVTSEKHFSHTSLFSFSPHRKPVQGRIMAVPAAGARAASQASANQMASFNSS